MTKALSQRALLLLIPACLLMASFSLFAIAGTTQKNNQNNQTQTQQSTRIKQAQPTTKQNTQAQQNSKNASSLKKKISDANSQKFNTGPKIQRQMQLRGWTKASIAQTIRNPYKTAQTRDTRYTHSGKRMNDPATAFMREDGHYVVVNQKNNDIVGISDRNNPKWKSPFQ